jgi:3-deoxy-D-manno-octulosonic-acid transferase
MGEAQLVRLLADRLRRRCPDLPLAVSAFTPTGRRQLPEPPAVDAAFFAPLDFRGFAGRVLDALRPGLLVLVETELWPNLIHEAVARGVPVALVNARLAPERMGRYRRLRALYGPLLGSLAAIAAQSRPDADRFHALGLGREEVHVTGNVKYDLPPPSGDAAPLRERFSLDERRPVLVAGSTGAGEEPAVLDALAKLAAGRNAPYLVLAPRHPQRSAEVAEELRRRGLRFVAWSKAGERPDPHDVLLVDTVGQLAALYRLGTVAFVGGSLVPVGGHNLLEPANVGVPVLFGPHTHHVAEMAETLVEQGAGLRVADSAELAREAGRLIDDPEARREMVRRAGAVLEANRGALERTVEFLLDLLDRSGGRAE